MKKSKVYLAQYTLPNIFRIGSVRFIPGLNYLTEEQWTSIKDHPLLPHRFKEGHIVWIAGKSPDDYVQVENSTSVDSVESDSDVVSEESAVELAANVLTSMNSKESINLIKETFDLDVLEEWKKKENRSGVIKAIDEQISALTALESDQD